MMRCIVVDDEPLVRELLEDHIRTIPFLTLVKSCKGSREAIGILENDKVDLVFLDIQMPVISGISLLQSLERPPLVIIISAYEQYALKGFELNVVDYLVKPFSGQRFRNACDRALELFQLRSKPDSVPAIPDHLYVHVEYELVRIELSDIVYIEGLKDYIRIYLQDIAWPVLTRMSMKSVAGKLQGQLLVRTHKSFMVVISRITTVKKNCVIVGNKEIPLSAHYRKEVLKLLK